MSGGVDVWRRGCLEAWMSGGALQAWGRGGIDKLFLVVFVKVASLSEAAEPQRRESVRTISSKKVAEMKERKSQLESRGALQV